MQYCIECLCYRRLHLKCFNIIKDQFFHLIHSFSIFSLIYILNYLMEIHLQFHWKNYNLYLKILNLLSDLFSFEFNWKKFKLKIYLHYLIYFVLIIRKIFILQINPNLNLLSFIYHFISFIDFKLASFLLSCFNFIC